MKMLKTHITEDKPYFSQKRSLLYILIVLPLIYFITNIGLNFATGALEYDIVKGFYLLFLADIILWKGALFAFGIWTWSSQRIWNFRSAEWI